MTSLSSVQYSNIPKEMQGENRWILWRPQRLTSGKVKKPPVKLYPPRNPRTKEWKLYPCDPTSDDSYDDFETITGYRDKICYDDNLGIGFRLGDGWCGIDLDHVIVAGKVLPAAQEIVKRVRSYTEVSPSGSGIRIFARGDVLCKRHSFPLSSGAAIEIYSDTDRYFTCTGNKLAFSLHDRGTVIQAIHDRLLALCPPSVTPLAKDTVTPTGGGLERYGLDCLTDDIMIKVMLADSRALRELWNRQTDGDDENRLDMALCCHLAYYCRNHVETMRRLFECSPHYHTKDHYHLKKWHRASYGDKTLGKAATNRNKFGWDRYKKGESS